MFETPAFDMLAGEISKLVRAAPGLVRPPGLETDTLHVKLPPGMDVQTAAAIFKRYGDMAHIGAIPGAKYSMVVVYYDVRSASALQMALGDWCQVAPEMGQRYVKMPMHMELGQQYICNVIDIVQDEDGYYTVKLYDSRTAEHLQEYINSLGCGEAYYEQAPAAAPQSRPAQNFPFLNGPKSERKLAEETESDDGDDQACDVQMAGLSEALCNGPCLQAMFEQAGLKGCVQRVCLRRGGPDGTALILTLSSRRSAKRCIRHFDGRKWGVEGGSQLTATMCEVPVSEQTSEQTSEHTSENGEQEEDAVKTKDDLVLTRKHSHDSTTAGTSEASD